MNTTRLKQVVAKRYGELDAGNRWDQAERVAQRALAWLDAAEDAADFDRDLVVALSCLVGIGAAVVQQVELRGAVEACFVEEGWTALRTRELMRSLERLPDKPKTYEEKLVADASTMTRLGLLGLIRHVAATENADGSLDDALGVARKALTRRVYTPAAHRESAALRDELRDLLKSLDEQLKQSKP